MNVSLITYTHTPEKIVACAAKLCYSNSDAITLYKTLEREECGEFIKKLHTLGHQSPLEHASFTFAIEGVSRSLLAQITRHRIASFSVQSQRYVNMEDKFQPIEPTEISCHTEAHEIFQNTMDLLQVRYHAIRESIIMDQMTNWYHHLNQDTIPSIYMNIEEFKKFVSQSCKDDRDDTKEFTKLAKREYRKIEKIANENARAILPNSCPTQMILTMNARELLHFFKVRCCNRAQDEIRELAWRMFHQVHNVAPNLFYYGGPSCLHGSCSEGKMTCGNPFQFGEDGYHSYEFNHIELCLSRAPGYVPRGKPYTLRIFDRRENNE